MIQYKEHRWLKVRVWLILVGCLLGPGQPDAVAAPLDCSAVSKIIPDAAINYAEDDSHLQYELSYEQGNYHWLGTAYEFHAPFGQNPLLTGTGPGLVDDPTPKIADNYRNLLSESGVHPQLTESRESTIKQGLVVTFEAVDKSLPSVYGLHAQRSGNNLKVVVVSGVANGSAGGSAPFTEETIEAVKNVLKSCRFDA